MILRHGGTRFRVSQIQNDGRVELEHCESKDTKTIQKGTLLSMIGKEITIADDGKGLVPGDSTPEEREIIARLPADMHSAAQVQVLISKSRWISALTATGVSARNNVDEIELKMIGIRPTLLPGTSEFRPRTIKDAWIKFSSSGNDPRVLMPDFGSRGGPGTPQINPLVEALLTRRLEEERPKETRLRPLDLHELHLIDAAAWNANPLNPKIEPASYRTTSRRYDKAYDAYDMVVRNLGEAAAKQKFRDSGVKIRAEIPLLATQFDDTDGEVFLIDELTGLPWGRAWLTLGIDECTAMILGKEISEQSRNVWSASSALINAILPKNMADPEYSNCKNPWQAYGKIGIAQFDNALYNRAGAFIEGVIADALALPGWSKPRVPTGKTQIENLNNLIKTDFTPDLPGWRGPKRDKAGLKEGPGSAIMSLQDYRKMFNAWVCDRYSLRARERGKSPKELWDKHFVGKEPRMPLDTQGFRLIATARQSISFRASGGILRKGLRYKSAALTELRDRLGPQEKVDIRYHPYDLSRIYVYHPELKVFLIVPCVESLDYLRGLTDHQQSLVLRLCRESGQKNPTLVQCIQAKADLRTLAEQLRDSRKMTERKRGYRMDGGKATPPESSPAPTPEASKIVLMTDLESRIRALSEVDLADNDEGYVDEKAA